MTAAGKRGGRGKGTEAVASALGKLAEVLLPKAPPSGAPREEGGPSPQHSGECKCPKARGT